MTDSHAAPETPAAGIRFCSCSAMAPAVARGGRRDVGSTVPATGSGHQVAGGAKRPYCSCGAGLRADDVADVADAVAGAAGALLGDAAVGAEGGGEGEMDDVVAGAAGFRDDPASSAGDDFSGAADDHVAGAAGALRGDAADDGGGSALGDTPVSDPGASGAAEPPFEERHLETDDGVLFLTATGVLLDGGSGGLGVGGGGAVRAALGLDAVAGVRVERVRRSVRPWIWFAVGLAATAGTWQLLDGGGYVRMLFPGLVALATAAMLAFALWSPARYVLTLSGAGDAWIAARVGGRSLVEAEDFADAVMAAAAGARRGPRMPRSPGS